MSVASRGDSQLRGDYYIPHHLYTIIFSLRHYRLTQEQYTGGVSTKTREITQRTVLRVWIPRRSTQHQREQATIITQEDFRQPTPGTYKSILTYPSSQ